MGMDMTETLNTAAPAVTLQRVVRRSNGDDDDEATVARELRLLFLGCESKPPYGPYEHTATLFLDLIALSIQEMNDAAANETYRVVLDVYHASSGHLPVRNAYAAYDGIILPGSFNSAYETEPWILNLSKIIQEEIVAKELPTLGVCFGHQLFAHSFEDGSAVKCPSGPQVGRKVSILAPDGKDWLPNLKGDDDGLQLFYTHGDMVESLPPQGRVLGGTDAVPIQAAIYFSKRQQDEQKPFAITFQAHPEYASSRELGLDRTLHQIMVAMHERQDISDEELQRAKADAVAEFETVRKHSIGSMITVGRLLGWFP